MKLVTVLALAFGGFISPLQAAPTALTFNATVTSSNGQPGLPAAGATISGRMLFDYDPAAFVAQPCPGLSGCVTYSYSSPYTFFVDLGTSQLLAPIWDLSVFDNTTVFDPSAPPLDVVELGTKVNGVDYLLDLLGPSTSFNGTSIPTPQVLTNFWTQGLFHITVQNTQLALLADVDEISVAAAPEPSTLALLLCGAAALVVRRRQVVARRL